MEQTMDKLPRTQSDRPKMGVLIPLANEEKFIENLLDGVLVHLTPKDRLYCVLDNVSKDNTKHLIEQRASKDPRVVLVWAPKNRCVVDAYFAGYRAAFEDQCEWILEMDGGFSHLPEQIPQFIEGMSQGYDYVGGSRYIAGGCHKSPWTRVLVSWGGTVLTNWMLRTRMTDMTSGFECFSRRAMAEVLKRGVASRANFFQTEIRALMHSYKWKEVPIRYRNTNYRIGRSSIREAFRILWAMRGDMKKRNVT